MAIFARIIKWLRDCIGLSLYDHYPIICVDFDGVIHSYTSGWLGVDVIPDPPVEGAIQWLRKHLPVPDALGLSEPYKGPIVMIYSSRSKSWKGRRAMKRWLIEHGLEREYISDGILKFPTKKPAAFLTIDDRAICFDGAFPSTDVMMGFKPWNKKPKTETVRKEEPIKKGSYYNPYPLPLHANDQVPQNPINLPT